MNKCFFLLVITILGYPQGFATGQVLMPFEIVPSPNTASTYIIRFHLSNRTAENIQVPVNHINYDPVDGMFSTEYAWYEVQQNDGTWEKTGRGLICGNPAQIYLTIPSGCLVELIVSLDYLRLENSPLQIRITIGDSKVGYYTSEIFTIDFAKDFSEGRFELAKKRYQEKIRRLLICCGFREETFIEDNFLDRFRESIMSVKNNEFGFAAYQRDSWEGDLSINPDGTILFYWKSKQIENHNFEKRQYHVHIIIDPFTFNPTLFQIYKKNIKIETDTARIMSIEIKDDLGLYLSNDFRPSKCTHYKFYFRIAYSPLNGVLPDEENSQKMFLQILKNFESWLKES